MIKIAESLEASIGWSIITHSLNTTDVMFSLYKGSQLVPPSSYELEVRDESTIVVTTGTPILAGEYRFVMIG